MKRLRRNPALPPGLAAIVCTLCGLRWRSYFSFAAHADGSHRVFIGDLEAASIEGSPGIGLYWKLTDGRTVMVAQPMTAGGDVVPESDINRTVEIDWDGSRKRPAQIEGTPAVCDFCRAHPIVAIMPVRRFMSEGRAIGGPTACCRPCWAAVRNDNREAIVRRAMSRIRDPRAERFVRSLVDEYWFNRVDFPSPALLPRS